MILKSNGTMVGKYWYPNKLKSILSKTSQGGHKGDPSDPPLHVSTNQDAYKLLLFYYPLFTRWHDLEEMEQGHRL